jgi:hypothetical protein
MNRAARFLRTAVVVLVFPLLAGCGVRPAPAPLDANVVRERYTAGLSARLTGAAAIESRASLWLETARDGRWPGVLADLRLAGPDRLRLVVRSPLGTLLDLAGSGERVHVALPRRHAWGEFDSARDPLGIGRPVALAVRAAIAGWAPPGAAWDSASQVPGARRVRWSEDSLRVDVRVGPDGLPLEADVTDAAGANVQIVYESWRRALGTRWPESVRIEGDAGRNRLRCRIEGWRRFAPGDSARLAPAEPRGERIDSAHLLRWLSTMAEP